MMRNTKKQILAISGSTKANSTNEMILRAVAKLFRKGLNFEIYTRIAELPHFNTDLDRDPVPPAIINFRQLIENADGVIISTPEYVFSLPGSLKNALEWTVSTTVFSDKPTALIIAAASGEKALESLDLIMKTLGAKVGEHSKLILKAAKGKLDSDGHLADQDTLQKINQLMKSFIETLG